MTVASDRELGELRAECQAAATELLERKSEELETYRRLLTDAIESANEQLRLEVEEISGGHPLCVRLAEQTTEYVDWLQWSLWDLPVFALALEPPPATFTARVAPCAQIYLAGRIFDDVLDGHFWYKARRPTMLGAVAEERTRAEHVEGLTLLSGLLLLTEGILSLSRGTGEEQQVLIRNLLTSLRRTVLGAILEHAERSEWSPSYYERLIHLKNVDFWRILYTSIDPARQSRLVSFLERYYAFAQKLNDVQDFAEDEKRGQPNLVSVYLGRTDRREPGGHIPDSVERHLIETMLDLRDRARLLPDPERGIAFLKLGETLEEARRLGVFGAPAKGPLDAAEDGDGARDEAAAEPATKSGLGLDWYSSLSDVVERVGAAALVEVVCPVCASDDARRLFERQGFTIHRCRECGHVYVNPRIDLALQLEMARDLESTDVDNQFLEVQRIYAEPICHLLRTRTPGSRLLDLGFGRGYILKLARAYGFEVYGVDVSEYLAGQLRGEFGERLHVGALGEDEIPWDAFDVVVMSHVVEHLGTPEAVLRDVWNRIRPGGILFVAVPDIDSLQFQIFGKQWDVVNPLVHFQYFTEASLTRLLETCGFAELERIQFPPLPRELTPRWMSFMRQLGGDESGELAMIARRPAVERLLAATGVGARSAASGPGTQRLGGES